MRTPLIASLVLALTFTPVLAERFVKLKPKRRDESEPPTEAEREMQAELEEEGAGPFLRAIIRRYEWVLDQALNNRGVVVVVAAWLARSSHPVKLDERSS